MRWIKPIDASALADAARSHRLVVTVEENTECGGFGSGVAEVLSDLALTPPLLRLAVPDCFVTHGAMKTLLSDLGLTPEGVRDAVVSRLGRLDTGA